MNKFNSYFKNVVNEAYAGVKRKHTSRHKYALKVGNEVYEIGDELPIEWIGEDNSLSEIDPTDPDFTINFRFDRGEAGGMSIESLEEYSGQKVEIINLRA